MDILSSIILAVVEGLTEFLPVSSTGHMILTQGVLGLESTDYMKAFTVMIQFGAILSVLVYYWRRFIPWGQTERATPAGEQSLAGWGLYGLMFIGCLPAAVLGLLFEKHIDALLGSLWVVIGMLFVGGLLMVWLDDKFKASQEKPITARQAVTIGFFQCLAMIPGVSRSMATIFGGMQQGLTRRQAAEFSFFLAIPTMFGATLLKAYKLYKEHGIEIYVDNWLSLLVGNIVAFVVALIVIKYFISFVSQYGFKVFGYYRILLAIVFAVMMLAGVPINL